MKFIKKLELRLEEVVRSSCPQCNKNLGAKVKKPTVGITPKTGTNTQLDNTELCPQCSNKQDTTPDIPNDRLSNQLKQITSPAVGVKGAKEEMPTGRIANQYKPDLDNGIRL